MLGKVKKWLGIEGVKLDLLLPDDFNPKAGVLEGRIRLISKNPQTILGMKVVLIEKYARGRNEDQLIDEYELGTLVLKNRIEVPGDSEPIEVPFSLKYELAKSPVDEFGSKNPLYGGLAWAAKRLRRVNSEYRVEAEANIKGVGLNPYDRKVL